ncbi:MAG: PEP-CTERM sorting domain-containing protein [Armatimonadota bacterium]
MLRSLIRSRLGTRLTLIALLAVGVTLLSAISLPAAEFVPQYVFTDLGVGVAYGVNDGRQVVGSVNTQAVVWGTGATAPTYLTSLGGTHSEAYAINADGQIVGYSQTVNDAASHAVWWNGEGVPTDLRTLGGNNSSARDINGSGQIVGYSYMADGTTFHAALWAEDGARTDIGSSLGTSSSYSYGVSENGRMAGGTRPTWTSWGTAARWDSSGTITSLPQLAGAVHSSANAVNDSGQTVGYSVPVTMVHSAVLWDSAGGATALSTLGGQGADAYDINNAGWVVGSAAASDGRAHACLWIGGTVFDLNSCLVTPAGSTLTGVRGINSVGDVVGSFTLGGQQHAFLLTLQNEDPASVPEPSTLALLSGGAMFGAGLLRRKRRI